MRLKASKLQRECAHSTLTLMAVPPRLYSAIQLYSAIHYPHYTAIHRYTLYNLCNTPLEMDMETTPEAPCRIELQFRDS